MSIIRWSPMFDPFQEMEDMMRRMSNSTGLTQLPKSFIPAMDVYEEKDQVIIEAPLVGVKAEDVQVSVEHGVLTLQGTSQKQHEVEEKNYYAKEVRTGSFFRQLVLPVEVNEEHITAEYAHGILKITCPKATPTKGKKVTVKVSQGDPS